MDNLHQNLENIGLKSWNEILYGSQEDAIAQGEHWSEDLRKYDWRYLLPHLQGKHVLIVGSQWGTLPFELSQSAHHVYVGLLNSESLNFFNIRIKEQKKQNITPFIMARKEDLDRFQPMDLIISLDSTETSCLGGSFKERINDYSSHLTQNGILFLSLDNRLGYKNIISKKKKRNASYSLRGYKRELKKRGFGSLEFYAPLPRQDGVPMFILPLKHNDSIRYFFQYLFPLVNTASPEMKKKYALDYWLARASVFLSLKFKLTSLMKNIFPGFYVIAKKGNN